MSVGIASKKSSMIGISISDGIGGGLADMSVSLSYTEPGASQSFDIDEVWKSRCSSSDGSCGGELKVGRWLLVLVVASSKYPILFCRFAAAVTGERLGLGRLMS